MGLGNLTGRCLRKIRYPTKAEATAALERYHAMGYPVSGQVAYACHLCGGSHVGMGRKRAKAVGR